MAQKEKNQIVTAWIYFTDKGKGLMKKLESTRMNLTDRCYQRRLRGSIISNVVDLYDVPVHSSYSDRIRKTVKRIRHESRWLNAVSVDATVKQLERIAKFSFVKKIDRVNVYSRSPKPIPPLHYDIPHTAQDIKDKHKLDYGSSYSQLDQINVPELHDMGYSGKGVLICMLDSGFNNLSHEAFASIDIIDTWDFVNNDAQVFEEPDDMGEGNHGTWTLGTIAGFKPGKLIGPAYNASFLLAKVENDEWERHVEEDHWIAGAEWADKKGADIISSSIGYRDAFTNGEENYTWEDFDGETTVISTGATIAAKKGILIVNCAGNEYEARPPFNTLVGPADCENILTVGAVTPNGNRVDFSSMGPTSDGRIKPDVMARGTQVYLTDVGAEDEYVYEYGTSFSTPLVAGTAALLLEAHPNWTNWQIMDALKNTAGQSDTPDFSFGWGIVDALKAVSYKQKEIYPPLDFCFHELLENDYIFFSQYIETVTWKPNFRNTNNIKFYRLYRKLAGSDSQDFVLVVELDSNVNSYQMRGLREDEVYLYKITAVDDAGKESDPNYALAWRLN